MYSPKFHYDPGHSKEYNHFKNNIEGGKIVSETNKQLSLIERKEFANHFNELTRNQLQNNAEQTALYKQGIDVIAGNENKASKRHIEQIEISRDLVYETQKIGIGVENLNSELVSFRNDFNWKVSALIEEEKYSNEKLDNMLLELKRPEFVREIDEFLKRGEDYSERKLIDEALDAYLEGLKRDKVNFAIQYKVGKIFLSREDFEKAAEHFFLSGKYATGDRLTQYAFIGYLYAAQSYYFLGNYSKAIDIALLAKDINSKSSQIFYDLSKYQANYGETEKSLENLEIAIKMNPLHSIETVTDPGFDVIREKTVILLEKLREELLNDIKRRLDYLGNLNESYVKESYIDKQCLIDYAKIATLYKTNTYLDLLEAKEKLENLVRGIRLSFITTTNNLFIPFGILYDETIKLCKSVSFSFLKDSSIELIIDKIIPNIKKVEEFRELKINFTNPQPNEVILLSGTPVITNFRVIDQDQKIESTLNNRNFYFELIYNIDNNSFSEAYFLEDKTKIKLHESEKDIMQCVDELKNIYHDRVSVNTTKYSQALKNKEERIKKEEKENRDIISIEEKKRAQRQRIFKEISLQSLRYGLMIALLPSVILGIWLKESIGLLVPILLFGLSITSGLLVNISKLSQYTDRNKFHVDRDNYMFMVSIMSISVVLAIIFGSITKTFNFMLLSNGWGENYFYYIVLFLIINQIVSVFIWKST